MYVKRQRAGVHNIVHHSFHSIFEFLMLVWTQVFYRILWMYVNMQECTWLHPGNTQRLFWYHILNKSVVVKISSVNPKCVHNLTFQYIWIYYIYFFLCSIQDAFTNKPEQKQTCLCCLELSSSNTFFSFPIWYLNFQLFLSADVISVHETNNF